MLDKRRGSLYNKEKKRGSTPCLCTTPFAHPGPGNGTGSCTYSSPQRQYRHFISGLGESVQYAKEQGGLYVRQDGRQFRAREPASRLYLEVSAAGMGKRQNSAPKSVPDAELEFGNGCILRFWGLDVWDGYNRQWVPGVFVWYRGANGKIYMYDTDRMQWQTLVRCLPEE